MRTAVYIDGFNLYYRALKNTPYKWLDVKQLVSNLLQPKHVITELEVVYEVKVSGRNRNEATNLVAQRRGTAPQTVIDKYCRQLNKKAFEIDRLLEDENISEFRSLLEKRFINHKDIVDAFFDDIYEKTGTEEYYA